MDSNINWRLAGWRQTKRGAALVVASNSSSRNIVQCTMCELLWTYLTSPFLENPSCCFGDPRVPEFGSAQKRKHLGHPPTPDNSHGWSGTTGRHRWGALLPFGRRCAGPRTPCAPGPSASTTRAARRRGTGESVVGPSRTDVEGAVGGSGWPC